MRWRLINRVDPGMFSQGLILGLLESWASWGLDLGRGGGLCKGMHWEDFGYILIYILGLNVAGLTNNPRPRPHIPPSRELPWTNLVEPLDRKGSVGSGRSR